MSDEWMFDRRETRVSAEAYVFSREMSRVSGALSGLRSLLTQISTHSPMLDLMPEGVPFGAMVSDAMLFEGEPMAASYGPAPVEDAYLFEEQPAFMPALVRRGGEAESRVA